MTPLATHQSAASPSNGLFVFGNDLRVRDNRALYALSVQVERLDCLFVVEPNYVNYNSASRGAVPMMYLMQTLAELNEALRPLGQQLTVLDGEWVTEIVGHCVEHNITHVALTDVCGDYEEQALKALKGHLMALDIKLTVISQHTLFEACQWPQEAQPHTVSFSRFRRKVEQANLSVKAAVEITELAPPILLQRRGAPSNQSALIPCPQAHHTSNHPSDHRDPIVNGTNENGGSRHERGWMSIAGCHKGQAHLKWYFDSELPQSYKQTRNAIDDWDSSTKLSPWLAFGSLSVREVFQALRRHEDQYGASDSSQWIKFELLWREYFHWQMLHAGSSMFAADGVNGERGKEWENPATNQHRDFRLWSYGQTPYPIVNAIMRQLNRTGYISNRARQIAASCWVNEYKGDWRWGAAHFQQQLIDFDVAVNWGNWQYIAGVGFDSKGGRHFDLGKQTRLFDPLGHYIQRWAPMSNSSQSPAFSLKETGSTGLNRGSDRQLGLPI